MSENTNENIIIPLPPSSLYAVSSAEPHISAVDEAEATPVASNEKIKAHRWYLHVYPGEQYTWIHRLISLGAGLIVVVLIIAVGALAGSVGNKTTVPASALLSPTHPIIGAWKAEMDGGNINTLMIFEFRYDKTVTVTTEEFTAKGTYSTDGETLTGAVHIFFNDQQYTNSDLLSYEIKGDVMVLSSSQSRLTFKRFEEEI
ncbi:MAG: hypothetical protein LBS74_01335 [Oscillospiraceae bacterium]|nr:hypothetical protein [Oscillospiraceae bacterium]